MLQIICLFGIAPRFCIDNAWEAQRLRRKICNDLGQPDAMRVATVVNFPSGDSSVTDVAPLLQWEAVSSMLLHLSEQAAWAERPKKKETDKASEVRHALELGADEIDLVIDYKAPLDS